MSYMTFHNRASACVITDIVKIEKESDLKIYFLMQLFTLEYISIHVYI